VWSALSGVAGPPSSAPPLVEYDVAHACEVDGRLALVCGIEGRVVERVEYTSRRIELAGVRLVLAPGPGILRRVLCTCTCKSVSLAGNSLQRPVYSLDRSRPVFCGLCKILMTLRPLTGLV
jgi:hypothetical protein